MSTTMTSDEQQAAKQQVLAAFEHGCSVCAVRRVAISLPEAGGMREDIPGLSVYLETKVEGDKAD